MADAAPDREVGHRQQAWDDAASSGGASVATNSTAALSQHANMGPCNNWQNWREVGDVRRRHEGVQDQPKGQDALRPC